MNTHVGAQNLELQPVHYKIMQLHVVYMFELKF